MKITRLQKSFSYIWMLILGICVLFHTPTSYITMFQVSGEDSTSLKLQSIDFSDKFGSLGTGNGQFDHPQGIAVSNTHIFVSEISNNRIQIFDLAGNFVTKFGSSGTVDGQFSSPNWIAINNTHIFVSELGNGRIQIFDLAGNFVTKFGSIGSGDGQFDGPQGIAVNSTHIFVADFNNGRIQIFDLAGNFVNTFGSNGVGDGQLNHPLGISINGTHVFVADSGNNRIQIFDSAGNYVTKFGFFGSGDGQFDGPNGITVNGTHIFVVDSGNNQVQIFDDAGNFVTKFGRNVGVGQLSSPNGIAVNSTHIFVAESFNSWVQIFNMAGNSPSHQELDQERLISPISSTTIYVGLITLFGLSIFVYYFWFYRRISIPINKSILKILDPLIKNNKTLNLLLHSRSDRVDIELEKKFQEIIPHEIFQYKFLLHPVRLSITKLLHDFGTLSIIEIKEILTISSSDVNNQLQALIEQNYIETEVKFINETPTKIIHLSSTGSERFRVLANLLTEFASK